MEFSRLKFTYKLRKVLLFLGLVFVFPEFSHGSEFYDRGKGDSSEEHSFFIGRGFIPHESVEYKDLRVSTKTDSTENIQRSKPISNKENVLKVLGKEEHLKFPNMAIGRLISYFYKEDGKSHVVLGKGTAVMISPHCALTSGHNIRRLSNIDGYPNAATSWIFYPGFYGENVYFEETAEKIKVCRQWYMDQDKDYDLGLLYFEKPIGLTTGYIRLKISTEADLLGKKIKILGYPAYEKGKLKWSPLSRPKILKIKHHFFPFLRPILGHKPWTALSSPRTDEDGDCCNSQNTLSPPPQLLKPR